ncbi:hypothetical protein NQD34_017581 [Periophthalmus magnuspinnatus]|nr:hypothetical protein NQD34_017581 [Periophthalmus magnuspinnatus]
MSAGRCRGRLWASPAPTPAVTEQERLLFLKLKMALAVAIIKSKPQGTSVREFSQKLASNLRNSNEIWKKRAEDLEREVLRLRQELLLTRAQGEEPEEHTESEVLEVFSQDLFAPIKDTDQLVESDSETPDLLLDVHTNTYVLPSTCTNTTATTATITATATSAAPAAALSRDSAFTRPAFFSHTQDALPHVQFIQTLCSLQHFASPQSDPLCLGLAPEGGPVLEESMSQLLHSIWAVFRASAPSRAGAPGSSGQTSGALYPSHSALLRACEVLTSALEVYCLHWNPSVELSVSVEEVMGGLTQTLLHQEPQEQVRVTA